VNAGVLPPLIENNMDLEVGQVLNEL